MTKPTAAHAEIIATAREGKAPIYYNFTGNSTWHRFIRVNDRRWKRVRRDRFHADMIAAGFRRTNDSNDLGGWYVPA